MREKTRERVGYSCLALMEVWARSGSRLELWVGRGDSEKQRAPDDRLQHLEGPALQDGQGLPASPATSRSQDFFPGHTLELARSGVMHSFTCLSGNGQRLFPCQERCGCRGCDPALPWREPVRSSGVRAAAMRQ